MRSDHAWIWGGLVFLASAASASDGVLEINQTCAAGTGCFQGDAAGFPVTIAAEGSYRLTSDLVVPAGTDGLQLASNVSLDLNQFSVRGPVVCSPCGATGSGTGIASAAQGGRNCTVRNGRVRGFGLDGVTLAERARIENLTLTDIARHALNLGGGSYVTGALIDAVGGDGIRFATVTPLAESLYRDNTISNVGQDRSLSGVSVLGGKASGPNSCPDQLCGTSGKKFFYLTPTGSQGADALAACAPGFHMASFWEIVDLGGVEYDTSRGATRGDSGQGPQNDLGGWIRTGNQPLGSPSGGPGFSNCNAWTSSSPAEDGTRVYLLNSWVTTAALPLSPWYGVALSCNSAFPVWCVQD